MATATTPDSLSSVVEAIGEAGSGGTLTLGEILDHFDSRSYGPLLLIIAIIAVGPTGAIPGMSILTGTLVILISAQMVVGRQHIWVPQRIENVELPEDKVGTLVEKALPWTEWIDKYVSARWTPLVDGVGVYVIGAVCSLLALTMFPLALVPFAVAIPGTAIGFFALALTARDGLLAAIGYAFTAIAIAFVPWALSAQ